MNATIYCMFWGIVTFTVAAWADPPPAPAGLLYSKPPPQAAMQSEGPPKPDCQHRCIAVAQPCSDKCQAIKVSRKDDLKKVQEDIDKCKTACLRNQMPCFDRCKKEEEKLRKKQR